MKNMDQREQNIRNLLTVEQIQMAYKFLCLNHSYRVIDSHSPLNGSPGYEESNKLLLVMRNEMRSLMKELVDNFCKTHARK
jgi:hypothetical protein